MGEKWHLFTFVVSMFLQTASRWHILVNRFYFIAMCVVRCIAERVKGNIFIYLLIDAGEFSADESLHGLLSPQ
jgi:hypothetical protein